MRTSRLLLSNALLLLLLAIALLLPVSAFAQTGAGSLTGIVGDQSGAAVPGAAVTATNQATNVNYTAVSNDAGNYTVTALPVGIYVVKAELSGFKTAATPPIQVEALQTVRVDFKLELGAIEETVVVVGTSPLLQTETATVGEVISGTTVGGCRSMAAIPGRCRSCCPEWCRQTPAPSPRSATSAAGGRT